MAAKVIRCGGRSQDTVRPVTVEYDIYGYAAGSLLYSCGDTKILCAITIQDGVPHFLRGKGGGWLTAEYSMLPAATTVRTPRETSTPRANGRSVEISRLIGRVLRTVIDFQALGERTIFVDCDVLQADGGTRTASITAASLALVRAQARWMANGLCSRPVLKDTIAAVSVGCSDSISKSFSELDLLLDPDFKEDRDLNADFNVVITRSGKLIEIQGGAERAPMDWKAFEQVCALAMSGVKQIFEHIDTSVSSQLSVSDLVPVKGGGVTLAERFGRTGQV